MHKIWSKESAPILFALALFVIIGLISEAWLITALIILPAYIFWLYRRIARLERWLSRGSKSSEVYDDQGIFNDIIRHLYQQRKLYNKRKKRTKEILRRLHRNISALPDATVLLNDQLEIEWSNAPAEYLLGINNRHDIGQRISNLIRHPEFLRYLISPDNKSRLEIQSPIDRNTTLQVKIVRFGRNQRLLIARNISDQKQLQEGLKKFVANASHELKTPLTTISGHLEMLENENGLSVQGKKSVAVAQKQSHRMKNLIQDLLLLSQVESYQLQPGDGDHLSLTEIMTNTMAAVDRDCSQPSITCNYPDDCSLLGIKSEIEGICINLVENAIKYSPDDESPIEIRWRLNKKDELVFEVTDQGHGISEQELPHVTKRYFRGSLARSGAATGSGLGLAIVQHAASKHGAHLDIDSKLNQGSRFWVTFPSYRTIKDQQQASNVVKLVAH